LTPVKRFSYTPLKRFRRQEEIEMLEVLVALDVAQREMKNQFELDAPARANARDADRKRRSPVRAARALALRVLPKAQTIRSSQRGANRVLGEQRR
jgi:hypothetical protein